MPAYHHGARVIEVSSGARPIRTVASAIIGVVITAPKGPVNTPTLIAGSSSDFINTFGSGYGTVDQVADGIFDQIGALCVVVNVLDPTVHKAAVAATEYTFDATSDTLTVADTYISNAVVTSQDDVTTYVEGVDYSYDSDTGVFTRIDGGGIAAGATVKVGYDIPDADAVVAADVIGTVDAGTGDHSGLQSLLVSESALGVKPRILGAPGLDEQTVATELVTIADSLRAFAYVSAYGSATAADAVTYRNNFASKRLMVIFPDWLVYDTASATTGSAPAVARALGMRAKLDNDIGWHKTISNMPVNGVVGIDKDISWDLQDPNTLAGYLNANEVTTLINSRGYRFWGSRTCSADPLFAFESASRTGDILADTIAEAHLWAVDKPMSKTLINDIVEGVNAKFRELKAQGYIVDATAWIDTDKNTDNTLAAGELYISYDYTPVPPLESLNFYQTITDDYLVQLVA